MTWTDIFTLLFFASLGLEMLVAAAIIGRKLDRIEHLLNDISGRNHCDDVEVGDNVFSI